MEQNTTFTQLYDRIRLEADGAIYENMEYEIYQRSAEYIVDKNITRIIEQVIFSCVIQPILNQTYDFYDYDSWLDL